MRQALHEAEAFCSELQAKVRDYQSNTLALQTSMETLEGEVDKSRKQMAVLELQNEKNQSAITRFKAEREANDRIKEVLEAELMEARGELNVARINDRPSQEETKLSFEVEKLLVALGIIYLFIYCYLFNIYLLIRCDDVSDCSVIYPRRRRAFF